MNHSNESSLNTRDYIIGRNACLEAIKSGRVINKILILKGNREGSINRLITEAKEKGIVIQEVNKTKLDGMSHGGNHQGCLALVSPKEYVEVSDILEFAKSKNESPFIVILDGLNDAHNLGSIIRTAHLAGVHGIIIPKRRTVTLSSVVSKVSAGALEYMRVSKVTNISNTIDDLKDKGIWIFGTDINCQNSIYKTDLKGNIAIVIGSEGQGISSLVKSKCDFLVNIPMKGEISSLNVAVAGALIIYEVLRQRDEQN